MSFSLKFPKILLVQKGAYLKNFLELWSWGLLRPIQFAQEDLHSVYDKFETNWWNVASMTIDTTFFTRYEVTKLVLSSYQDAYEAITIIESG